jgi:integrase
MARRGPNEGNIYQRADGRWEARLHLGYQGGRRVRKSFYGHTRRAVQEQLTRALRDVQRGLPLASEDRMTVEQYLRRWLAETVKPAVRPSTYRSYEMLVRVHLVPELGRIALGKLMPQEVQRLLNSKLADGLSPRSVHHLHAVLRRALNQAYRWELIPRNVALLVDPPRVPSFEVRPLTPDQARLFLDAAAGNRLGALFVVALALGLRQGEVLGLSWEDIDLQARTLTVRRSLQRIDGVLRLVEPKTSRSRRMLTVPTLVVDALRAHRTRQLEERLWAGARWREYDLVFTSTIGTPLDGTNVTHRLHILLEQAGLPRQRFHDLRHACASLLLAQGVHPRVVMETLGHSQISLTMNTYSHVMPDLKSEAAERMQAILAARPEVVG